MKNKCELCEGKIVKHEILNPDTNKHMGWKERCENYLRDYVGHEALRVVKKLRLLK